ncbi:MAG: hypothetical protein G8D58_08420 [gamma proteobacterium symbiont of Phacoides pectinatus]
MNRVSYQNVNVGSSYSAPNHTVSLTLPRAFTGAETVTVQLVGNYELVVNSSSATLVDTSGPTNTDITSNASGLTTASISVNIDDASIGSPGSLSPTTSDQLTVSEDQIN